jgi:transposase InsO family protein
LEYRNSIITDLGSNFTSSEFFDFYEQKSIQIKYASVAHPRANGQVERANRMILEALRKKVFDKNEKFAGKWIRELPYVVLEPVGTMLRRRRSCRKKQLRLKLFIHDDRSYHS